MRSSMLITTLILLVIVFGNANAEVPGYISSWGRNNSGQCSIPEPNQDFIDISAGLGYHSLGLKENGTLLAWGHNGHGQCDVPDTAPFIDIAAGYYHSIGLLYDQTIYAWGFNDYGQCDVPFPNINFLSVTAGWGHSAALRTDGSITAWGMNEGGQCNVPSPNSGFSEVVAGGYHTLGLKSDGSIRAWGQNNSGQTNVPAPNMNYVAIAAGANHSLGLKSNGSIIAWGRNNEGQCNVPTPNEGYIAVAAGWNFSLGLKSDSSIVAWGYNGYGQCNIPFPNMGFSVIDGGAGHSLGLRANYDQEIVNIQEPISTTVWDHYTTNHSVVWEYPELDTTRYNNNPLTGDSVCISLYKNEVFIDTLIQSTENTGTWTFSNPVPGNWLPGNDYQIYVIDDLGFYGWSEEFTVAPSTGADVIAVTEPDSSTIWTHFETSLAVEWEYPALLGWFGQSALPGMLHPFSGEQVSIFLYDGDDLVATLGSSIANIGSWTFEGPVPMEWEPGIEYQIYIEDDLGNFGWGEEFTVAPSTGADVIAVTEPDSSTIWTHFETSLAVEWEYPAPLGLFGQSALPGMLHPFSGEQVSIFLYDGDDLVATLGSSIANIGSWAFEGPVPMEWEPGIEYQIYIEDDLGNFGWGEEFTVAPSTGADVITVTEPDSSTIWTHFETSLAVEWEYPALLGWFGQNALPGMLHPFSGEQVSIFLYDGDDLVATLGSSIANIGSWAFEGPVPMEWEPGIEYQIYIEDDLGNFGWGEEFTVAPSTGADVITVTEPDSSTIWTHFDTSLAVEWKYPELPELYDPGQSIDSQMPFAYDSVSISLYNETTPVAILVSSTANDGSWVFEGPVPMNWTPEETYRIFITDDSYNIGWSDEFTIAPSEGEEVITVTEPDSTTIWSNVYLDRTISWVYPAKILCDHTLKEESRSGDLISILLYKESVFVDTLIASASNTGEFLFNDSLPEEWEDGLNYSIHIIDNLANHGWSTNFSIQRDMGITHPNNSDNYQLFPVTPNPTGGTFTISYYISDVVKASVDIFDLSGRLVSVVSFGEQSMGLHNVEVSGLSSGFYFCKLRVGSLSFSESFVVIR